MANQTDKAIPDVTEAGLQKLSKEALCGLVLLLVEQNRKLADQNKMIPILEARIAELERRLGMDSTNSSKPPSSDPPGADAKRKAKNKAKSTRQFTGW